MAGSAYVTIINHDDFSFSPGCKKLLSACEDKKIYLDATGTRETNALDKLLRCECKARKCCSDLLAAYAACHSGIMGVGAYKGKQHCGEEMASLKACVMHA